MLRRERGLGLFDRRQDALGLVVIDPSALGQRQMPGRAHQQARAQMFLQPVELAADRR